MPDSASDSVATVDAELVATGHGDMQAFERLYDEMAPRIHGLVLRILRDAHQSEDVTQEVFLDIWRNSSRFDGNRGSALAWLMTLAHRRAVDRVRSNEAWHRREVVEAAQTGTEFTDETEEAAHASLEAQSVRKAVAALSPCQRQAIELAYFGGLTHSEVSQALQVPLGTAKSRIRDGLTRLRGLLSVMVMPPASAGPEAMFR